MTTEERRALLDRAITAYGAPAQMDMAVEEMAELTKAICKVKRVSCEIVPGGEATDAGYRPHWATCPQAGQFKRGGRARE